MATDGAELKSQKTKGIRANIARVIRENGKTQAGVAAALGKDKDAFRQRLKRVDEGAASIGFIAQIADIVGCDIADFFRRGIRFRSGKPDHSQETCFKILGVEEQYRAAMGLQEWLRKEGLEAKTGRIVAEVLRFADAPKEVIVLLDRVLDGKAVKKKPRRRKAHA